jgi:hypothetical protein
MCVPSLQAGILAFLSRELDPEDREGLGRPELKKVVMPEE